MSALEEIDLSIESGQFIAIMGENGAGKTTLAKHLNGLLKPSSGRVLVDGEDTRKVSVAHLARKVGLVFHNPDHLLFSETVKDEVAFGLKNFGFSPEVVEKQVGRTLEALGLAEFVAESNPKVILLSKGQIVGQGSADSVLSRDEMVNRASLVKPQMSRLFGELAKYGLPRDVVDVHRARILLEDKLGEVKAPVAQNP